MYLTYEGSGAQTLQKLLVAIWQQLSLSKDLDAATQIFKSHEEKNTPASFKEIQELLLARVAEYTKVYIIIDGLEEYVGSQQVLLHWLLKLGSQVGVMVTGRGHLPPPAGASLQVELSASVQDVTAYVLAQLKSLDQLKSLIEQTPALQEKIITHILTKAHGMYEHLLFFSFFFFSNHNL